MPTETRRRLMSRCFNGIVLQSPDQIHPSLLNDLETLLNENMMYSECITFNIVNINSDFLKYTSCILFKYTYILLL